MAEEAKMKSEGRNFKPGVRTNNVLRQPLFSNAK